MDLAKIEYAEIVAYFKGRKGQNGPGTLSCGDKKSDRKLAKINSKDLIRKRWAMMGKLLFMTCAKSSSGGISKL